jgi:Ca2+-binding EF-hand superfamily protein
MLIRTSKWLLVTSAIGIMGTAYAENPTPEAERPTTFVKADANQDGKVTYEEYRAASEKRIEAQFSRMDLNGDGFIDEAERQALKEKMKGMRVVRKTPPEISPP